MSSVTDIAPWLGRPDRVTVYTGGATGTHVWLPGATMARITVVGAGGAGGLTGKWLDGATYRYSAGSGGSAGALIRAMLALNPAGEPATPYAVGSGAANLAGGASYLGAYLYAEGGLRGNDGSSVASTAGAATASPGQVTSTIYGTGSITRPRVPALIPGQAGAAGSLTVGVTAGDGGSTLYGQGGAGVPNPAAGPPLAGLSPLAGQYGAGASGGTSAPGTATNHTIPASAAGAHGIIIIEERR